MSPDPGEDQEVASNGTTIHVRVGGSGPAVVLLHGYGDTGDVWVPLARELARNHRVIVPDLRGMGLSARAEAGFEKANEAADNLGVMDALGVGQADVVAHDIGNMVAYAFAARHPERVRKLVLKSKPLAQKTAADYGVDVSPRLTTLKVVEPAKRSAGVKVADVDALVGKLQSMGIAK